MQDNVFTIDTTPSAPYVNIDIPQYGVSRKSTELIKLEEKTVQRPRTSQNPNPCWNCGKPFHSIRECKVDMNLITIEWNKELQMLMKEHQGYGRNAARYHDHEKANKYAHLIPGTISSQTRKMMGLSEHELPSFIYRLRKHGYPKAWLRHASVKPSGINVYDAHGNEVADPDAEEGEILEEEDKIRYDLSKLIKFPGFNAPMPEDIVDGYEEMNAPTYNEFHSLENMISDLQEKAVTEYRLKKDRSTKSKTMPNSNNTSSKMNVDKQEDDINASAEPSDKPSSSLSSPEGNSSQLDLNTPLANLSQKSQESRSGDISINSPEENGLGRVLTSFEGTPILKSRSGHTRLPPPENFSKDICDVINFENLPESTGKFEKMRDLLKKVKNVLGFQRQNS